MGPNSITPTQNARTGDTRQLIVAVFGVWAMVLQSMLPFAGAMAAQSDNAFLVALCTTAGVENVYLGDGEGDPSDKTGNTSGCEVCTVCACTSGTGCGCGAIKLVQQRTFNSARLLLPNEPRLTKLGNIQTNHTRAPPA